MSDLDQIVFGRKKLSDIFREIYENSKTKDKQILTLIEELKEFIQNIGDAVQLVPLIAQYMELGIKNDDILVKMAAIAQKALQKKAEAGEGMLISDEEKEKLLADLKAKANNLKDEAEGVAEKAKDYFEELKTKGAESLKAHLDDAHNIVNDLFKTNNNSSTV